MPDNPTPPQRTAQEKPVTQQTGHLITPRARRDMKQPFTYRPDTLDADTSRQTYLDLFNTVKESLQGSIDRDRIQSMAVKIVTMFRQSPFNRLLLHFYNSSPDNYILAHITNNTILSVAFGNSLGLSNEDLNNIGIAAFCHDFGMAEYTHLFQQGTDLENQERALLQSHPQKSATMFESVFPENIINMVLDIHENVNGQGYPRGKTSVEIALGAKIIAICDVFEALTHPRNFRMEFSPYEAIKMIIKKKDIIFDANLINRFVEFMSIYPIGNLVNLNTGETGMIIASNPGVPTRAVVRILLNPQREVEPDNKVIDLAVEPMLYINGPVDKRTEKEILGVLNPRDKFELR